MEKLLELIDKKIQEINCLLESRYLLAQND